VSQGVFLQGFVLACEIFPTSAKMIMAPLTSLFATFGMLSLLIFAYFFRNWRHLQLAISVAGLPMVVYAWYVTSGAGAASLKGLRQ